MKKLLFTLFALFVFLGTVSYSYAAPPSFGEISAPQTGSIPSWMKLEFPPSFPFSISVNATDEDSDIVSLTMKVFMGDDEEGDTFVMYPNSSDPYGGEQALFEEYGIIDVAFQSFLDVPYRWDITLLVESILDAGGVRIELVLLDNEGLTDETTLEYIMGWTDDFPLIHAVTPESGFVGLLEEEPFVITITTYNHDPAHYILALQGLFGQEFFGVCVENTSAENPSGMTCDDLPPPDPTISVEYENYDIDSQTYHEWTISFGEERTNDFITQSEEHDIDFQFNVSTTDGLTAIAVSPTTERSYTFGRIDPEPEEEIEEEPETQQSSSRSRVTGSISRMNGLAINGVFYNLNNLTPHDHELVIRHLQEQLLALLQQLLALMIAEQQ